MKKGEGREKSDKYSKNSVMSFSISKEEAEIVNDASKERGCSKSSLIRKCLFSDFHIYSEEEPKLLKGIARKYSFIDSDEMEKYEEQESVSEEYEPKTGEEEEVGLELDAMLDLINEEEK
jgi:hypothetical protein